MTHNALILRLHSAAVREFDYYGNVVDLGCGSAEYRGYIEESGAQYLGVDWEGSAHDTHKADILANLSGRVPLEDECADIVTAFQVLEHMPNPDHFLAECCRLLRPGGRLYLTVPFIWHIHEEPHDYYRFTRYGLEHLIGEANLIVDDIRETTGFWQVWIMNFNYHVSRTMRRPLRWALAPLMTIAQMVAPILDGIHPDFGETASYSVWARKPERAE